MLANVSLKSCTLAKYLINDGLKIIIILAGSIVDFSASLLYVIFRNYVKVWISQIIKACYKELFLTLRFFHSPPEPFPTQ